MVCPPVPTLRPIINKGLYSSSEQGLSALLLYERLVCSHKEDTPMSKYSNDEPITLTSLVWCMLITGSCLMIGIRGVASAIYLIQQVDIPEQEEVGLPEW